MDMQYIREYRARKQAEREAHAPIAAFWTARRAEVEVTFEWDGEWDGMYDSPEDAVQAAAEWAARDWQERCNRYHAEWDESGRKWVRNETEMAICPRCNQDLPF